MAPLRITRSTLELGCTQLAERDPTLAELLARNGLPELWLRDPGFATLVRIILEQQVSLASARHTYTRLLDAVEELEPATVLALSDDSLRHIGFSRQKTAYMRALAHDLVSGRLDLNALGTMSDAEARQQLVRVKGIGIWTANIYLLMAMGRPDIWPAGDLALVRAAASLSGLEALTTQEALTCHARNWKPWRSVAARMLWHHYLRHLRPPPGTTLE